MDFNMQMRGFYIHSVCLPEKVTEQFASFVGRLLEFKCQGRESSWYIGLIRSGDKLVLQPGWSDFAHANKVRQNDLLRFKFLGGSKFEVRIFDLAGHEINSRFEGKAGKVKIPEGSISRSPSRIKTVTWVACSNNKANTVESNPDTRKRSLSQTQSSLPLKKRLKMSGSQSLSKEEGESMCKEVHTIIPEKKEELLESEGENDIPAGEKFNEWKNEVVDEAGWRDYLLVCKQQALHRMKLQDMKTAIKKENDISAVEKFSEWEKEGEEICRREHLLVCEHQALLRRKMQLPDMKTAIKKENDISALEKFSEGNHFVVCEHQALLSRRKMQLPDVKTAIKKENDISALEKFSEGDHFVVCEHQALLSRRKMKLSDMKTTIKKEYDISAVEKFSEWEKEGVEIRRRNHLPVWEYRALLRRKMQ